MRFGPALAAQATFQEAELGSDWDKAVGFERPFLQTLGTVSWISKHRRVGILSLYFAKETG